MIIETPYKATDTITIKTNAGEEIVARFVEENDKEITIEKPMAIMATGQGIGLGPFTFTINPEAKIKLNKNGCLLIHKTDGEMAKQYVSSTSGIQMV
jgi:hypothetical protein